MQAYELTIIYKSGVGEKEIDGIVKDLPFKVESTSIWGSRLFSYPIGKYKEGYYVNYVVSMKAEEVEKVRNALKLDKNVIRFLLIRINTSSSKK
jgi:ribosomal protein S6